MTGEPIRALTVRNPWARGFFHPVGAKGIENRTWRTHYRGRIAIHTAKRLEQERYVIGGEPDLERLREHQRDLGMFIGSVRLLSVHQQDSHACRLMQCRRDPWAMFAEPDAKPLQHWEVGHAREYMTPFAGAGKLGMWDPSPTELGRIRLAEEEALSTAQGLFGPVFR